MRSPTSRGRSQRDEFPFATYVFVADQLNLPAGLTTATLTGETTSGMAIKSQKEVLNIPDSARITGNLKKYMGNASYYKALARLEAKQPSTVISDSSTPVGLASRNAQPTGVASVKVNYTPAVAPAGAKAVATSRSEAERAKVRPVIKIERAETHRADQGSRSPARGTAWLTTLN